MKSYSEYTKEEFLFQGRKAVVFFPDEEKRTNKWIYKTEYLDAFPELQSMMLAEGYHLAHVDNETRWCRPSDIERQGAFCQYLHQTYGLQEKCAVVGMSCGGMQGIYLAASFPEHVAVLYLDAPVVNLLSCPGDLGKGKSGFFWEFAENRGMTMSELIGYRNHPLDRFPDLLKAKTPIILVCGDSDSVVPYEENGKLLYDFYQEHGGTIELHLKKGCDHHPHGLEKNQTIRDFIEKYY